MFRLGLGKFCLFGSLVTQCQPGKGRSIQRWFQVSRPLQNGTVTSDSGMKSILDFNCCRSYLLYRFDESPPITKADWESVYDNITQTKQAVSYFEEQFVSGYNSLSERMQKISRNNVMKIGQKTLMEYNRDYFILTTCKETRNLENILSFIDFFNETGRTFDSQEKCQICKIMQLEERTPSQDKRCLQFLELLEKDLKHDMTLFWPLVGALGRTSQWMWAYEIFCRRKPKENKSASKSTSILVKSAVKCHKFDLALELINNPYFHNHGSSLRENLPHHVDEIFLTWINEISRMKKQEEILSGVQKLFSSFGDIVYFLSPEVLESLTSLLQKKCSLAKKPETTYISRRGNCGSCNLHLSEVEISEEDVALINAAVDKKLIRKQDVHLTSSPEEYSRFKRLLSKAHHYDVVVDGLNVIYAENQPLQLKMRGAKRRKSFKERLQGGDKLLDVVSQLVKHDMKVLVVLRQHARKTYPQISTVSKLAQVIFFDNVSEDDPMMLLAATNRGSGAFLVTNDLLREHHYHLGNPNVLEKFKIWQVRHQIMHERYKADSKHFVKLKWPPKYEIKAQPLSNDEKVWHLPIANEKIEGLGNEMLSPNKWLCIKLK